VRGGDLCAVNLFSRIKSFFSEKEERSTSGLESPARWFLDSFGNSSSAGVPVNDDTALALSAVYSCCKVLSESIASLPVSVYQKRDGRTELAETSAANAIIAYPSPLYGSYHFRATMMLHLSLCGNAYALIERDSRMKPKRLTILPPRMVEPFVYKGELYYEYNGSVDGTEAAKRYIFKDYEVFHIRGLTYTGIKGKNVIETHRETIGKGLSADKFTASMFKNGTASKFVLRHPAKLTMEQVASMRNSWLINNTGAENVGKPPILENGMDIKPISLSAEDTQYIAQAKLTKEDIASIYRVPLHLIGHLDRATFNNIEHMSLDFITQTLRPIVRMWEEEINVKLLSVSERKDHFARFNFEGMLRADSKARAEFYTKMFGIGVFSQNEIRSLENLNPVEGGDAYYIPLNMINPTEAVKVGQPNSDLNDEEGASTEGASA